MIVKGYDHIFRKEASAMSTEPTISASDPASERPSWRRLKRGDVVHVRPGSAHVIYADLPMGGWSGTIERVQRHRKSRHRRCWVHFLTSTTERLHPVYIDREERDNDVGYQPWDNWVAEELLELGAAAPETIEHPDLPAWAQQAGDQQVRTLFGLDPEDDYPPCDHDTARVWKGFLNAHVPLPREVQTTVEYDFDCGEVILRKIVGPEEVPSDVDDEPHALYAEVSVNGEIEITPLYYVIPFDGDPYYTLLRDYDHWYDVVHGNDDSWTSDDDDDGMSLAEFNQMFRSGLRDAWKTYFGRPPSDSEIEMAISGDLFAAATRPVAEEAEEPENAEVIEPIRAGPRVGRNDPCPCGSGKKYKKCCLRGQ
jgi:hypothetical protein